MHRILRPTLGILDLSQGHDAEIAAADRVVLEPIFDNVFHSVDETPTCDVLFVYCALKEDGAIVGSDVRLPKIISTSCAMIAVVARENSAMAYVAALKNDAGQVQISENLVLTLNRRGEAFGRFFHRLFTLMRDGKSMPVAWVKLAPQNPNREQPENPDAIFDAGAGQVYFEKRKNRDESASGSALRSIFERLIGK